MTPNPKPQRQKLKVLSLFAGIGSGQLRAGIGHLNPTWVEWLMGFPPEWTDLEHSETP